MQVKFTRCSSSTLASVAITEGQLVYVVDTGETYLDGSSTRIKISDVVSVTDTDALSAITTPVAGKIYIVGNSDIYTYTGSEYVNLSEVDASEVAFSYSGMTSTNIEDAIKELKDGLTDIGDVSESEISDIKSDVSDLTDRVSANEGNISSLQTSVSTNTTNISANTTAIEGLQTTIANKEHFRGYYATIAEIETIDGDTGDYAYCAEDGYKYTYTDGAWTVTTETVPDQTVPKSETTPLMNGTASVGSETSYAAGDHVHPTDTTRASQTEVDTLSTQVSTNTADIANKVDKEDGKGLSTNDYTDEEKEKLAGIEENANNYTLPTASSTTLGGIKVGTNLSISDGVLSATDTTYSTATTSAEGLMSAADKTKLDSIEEDANNYSLPTASDTTLGGVKVGENLTIDDDGVLSAVAKAYDVATTTTDGLMSAEDKTKLDGLENYDDTELEARVATNESDIAEIKAVLEWNEA